MLDRRMLLTGANVDVVVLDIQKFVSRRHLRYLLRQARFGHNLANALDEGCGAERLLPQDHLNSGIQPRMILDRKVARSDDNDRELVPDRMLLHLCYELKSVHLWHHQIENDDVRNAFPELVEGDTPILGLDQQPCLGSQPGANALSLHCVILDDQDPGWWLSHEEPEAGNLHIRVCEG